MVASKLGIKILTKAEIGICVDRIYQNLDKTISRQLTSAKNKGLTAVYAYEDGALETLKLPKIRFKMYLCYPLLITF
jgi:hypothetical protein